MNVHRFQRRGSRALTEWQERNKMKLGRSTRIARRPQLYRAACAAAAAIVPTFASVNSLRADYVYTGPADGAWTDPANWTYVHSDPVGTTLPNLHDPMT